MGIERVRVRCCYYWKSGGDDDDGEEEEDDEEEDDDDDDTVMYDEEMGTPFPAAPWSSSSSIKTILGSHFNSNVYHHHHHHAGGGGNHRRQQQQQRSSSLVGLRPEDLFRVIASEVIPWASEKRSIRCSFYS